MYFVTSLLGVLTVVLFEATAGKEPVHSNIQSDKVKGILSPTIKVIQVSGENNNIHHSVWYSTSTELKKASNMDRVEKRIAVNKLFDIDGNPQMTEVVNGQVLSHSTERRIPHPPKPPKNRRRRNIQNQSTLEPVTAVVELSIVCDKSFSAIFHNNSEKILEYFTMYMWEVNMAFKTLPSSYILIRVTSIIVLTDNAAQPFVEVSREGNGKISLNSLSAHFADYMDINIGVFPQFDAAISFTNEPVNELKGRMHYTASACKDISGTAYSALGKNICLAGVRFKGILSMYDDGKLTSTLSATHGLAHVLGAKDDKDIDGCKETNCIMSGGKHYFSSCSDAKINEYIRSNNGICLRDTVHLADAVLDPYYNNTRVLSPTDQCRLRWDNVRAYIDDENMSLCDDIPCKVWKNGTKHVLKFNAVGNSPCGTHTGRCFRGKCLVPEEIDDVMRSSSSQRCQRFSTRFVYSDVGELIDCQPVNDPSSGIIIEGFVSLVFFLEIIIYNLY